MLCRFWGKNGSKNDQNRLVLVKKMTIYKFAVEFGNATSFLALPRALQLLSHSKARLDRLDRLSHFA